MRYLGGKVKLRKHIAPIIKWLANDAPILEPFMGGLNMTIKLQPKVASDLAPQVVTLVHAVRAGWRPPHRVDDELYQKARERSHQTDDPLVCFIGQFCTFGGKWFGGLLRPYPPTTTGVGDMDPTGHAARQLLKYIAGIEGVDIRQRDYRDCELDQSALIYCDPPYFGTQQYSSSFNHNEFWEWARSAAAKGNAVIVSELSAPEGIRCIFERRKGNYMNKGHQIERLYLLDAQ